MMCDIAWPCVVYVSNVVTGGLMYNNPLRIPLKINENSFVIFGGIFNKLFFFCIGMCISRDSMW